MENSKSHAKPKNDLIAIHDALQIIQDNIHQSSLEECQLEETIGKYLAQDVLAPEPSPRYTNSAMDGYALRWQDVMAASPEKPVTLSIVGESQAGNQFQNNVGKNEAVRISTGAVVPKDCDTVVRVEDTREDKDNVHILAVRCQGQDIRYQGEEFQPGDPLLSRGTRITAPRAALLASVGISTVKVFSPCRVAILVTGSELVAVGDAIKDDQIRDSNMIMLIAAIEEAGGRVVKSIRVADDEEETKKAIAETEADIILCTGGISVGRHDHVKNAATTIGYSPLFWRIRQKPGKPLFFARKGDSLLFGLPGNPVSAFMCYTHYVRPLISALNGKTFGWPMVSGKATEDIANNGKRTNMIRVKLKWHAHGGYSITHAAKQGSHMLTSLAHADGYIILEPGETLKEGQRIDVYRYDYLREPV